MTPPLDSEGEEIHICLLLSVEDQTGFAVLELMCVQFQHSYRCASSRGVTKQCPPPTMDDLYCQVPFWFEILKQNLMWKFNFFDEICNEFGGTKTSHLFWTAVETCEVAIVVETNVCTLCNPHACTCCCRFREKDFGSNDARRANQTRSAEGSGRQSTTEHTTTSLIRSVFHSNTQLPPLSGQCFTQHTTTSLIRSVFHSNTQLPPLSTTSLIRSVFHSNTQLPPLSGQCFTPTHNYLTYQVSALSNYKQLPPLSGQCFK